MDIRDLEIDCDDCGTSIGMRGRCYCENCFDKRDDEINELQKKIESLEGQIAELEDEISDLQRVALDG